MVRLTSSADRNVPISEAVKLHVPPAAEFLAVVSRLLSFVPLLLHRFNKYDEKKCTP